MNRNAVTSTGFLILMIVVPLLVSLNPPLYVMIIILTLFVAFFFGFSFTHGYQVLGGRAITVFFGITVLITYAMEWLGTHFGIPFGHYYYTNQLGPLIMDVPIVIPIQWFNMLYVCYIMSNIIIGRGDAGSWISVRLPRLLATSIIAGLSMVSWDFINDPYMVGIGSWVWTAPAEFLGLTFEGIPLSNFLGWVLTSALTVLLFDIYRYRSQESIKTIAAVPMNAQVLIPYLYMLVFPTLNGIVAGVITWTPIVLASVSMGLAAILTCWRYITVRTPDPSQ